MSSFVAILVVLGLFLVALAPLGLASARIIGWAAVAIYNGLLILVVASYQASLLASPGSQLPNLPEAGLNAVPRAQCVELISALEQGRVVLDRSTPPRIVVSRGRWSQLPEQATGLVLDCVQRAWPEGAPAPQLEMRAD